jgi:hypothetical protein
MDKVQKFCNANRQNVESTVAGARDYGRPEHNTTHGSLQGTCSSIYLGDV